MKRKWCEYMTNNVFNQNFNNKSTNKKITGLDSQTALGYSAKMKSEINKYAIQQRFVLPPYVLAFNLKLKKQGMYINLVPNYKNKHICVIDLNPILAIENKQELLVDNAKRIALKLSMLNQGENYQETSKIYQSYCRQLHIHNFHGLPETPFKYFVIRCRLCREPFYIFNKKPPVSMVKHLLSITLPYHKSVDFNSSMKTHQGTLSQGSYEELNNSQAWFYFQRMANLNDYLNEQKAKKENEFHNKYF